MNYLTDLDFGEAEPGGRYVLLSAFQTSPVPGKLTSAVALTIALRHLTQKQSVNSWNKRRDRLLMLMGSRNLATEHDVESGG